MTDLRTRIAAVLYAMDCDDYDIQAGEELDPSVFWAIREGAERRADAVIRELEADVMADDYVPPCCRPGGRCNR